MSPAQAADHPRPHPAKRSVASLLAGLAGHDAGRSAGTPETAPLTGGVTPDRARAALAQVEGLFAPAGSTPRRTPSESGDATMALRDLTLSTAALPAAARSVSTRANDRPWDEDFPGSPAKCASNICVHWISQADADIYGPEIYTGTNGGIDISRWVSRESWADTVLRTMVDVSRTYTSAGYRTPRADGRLGGTKQTDIYLTDPGANGQYGYCTVDGTVDAGGRFRPTFRPSNSHSSDLPAFCVLDNDYRVGQFGTRNKAIDSLRVTAAHEYFHAIQFAYDYLEDRWFMESTATWAEEQLYDHVNDNLQYLPYSQLRRPTASLDDYNALRGGLHYGDWIWFQYLSERLPTRTGAIPNVVLQMWQRADSVSGPDQYSLQAVVRTLKARGVSFPRAFAQYAAGNRHPATVYAEARANRYPTAPLKRTARLRPAKRQAAGSLRLNHLASSTVRFVPQRVTSRRAKLRLDVDMANRRAGSVAVVTTYARDGRITTKVLRLTRAGNGRVRVPFSSRRVRAVELTLVNASNRFKHCTSRVDGFSCGGTPVDQRMLERYTARLA